MKSWSMITLFLALTLNFTIQAQNLAFDPCDNGTEDSCKCETAQVVCSHDDLDGLSFSTSLFQHPEDGPSPLCPATPGTTANNPMWIAMIAQCEELTIEVDYYNCIAGDFDFLGLQVAVYSDCYNLPESIIECQGDPSLCQDDSVAVLELESLTIGDTYYFLFDGCAGSACDVDISVTNDCGPVQDNLIVNDDNDPDYFAAETLLSTALIDQQSNTTYNAGDTITLDSGFEIENPQGLEADVLNCVTNP